MCVHYVLLGYCLIVLVNWMGRISEHLDRTLNTPFLVTFLKVMLAVYVHMYVCLGPVSSWARCTEKVCVCVCVCVCTYVRWCGHSLVALFLTSEDFVVLGFGIMDDAEFDLPAAVCVSRVQVKWTMSCCEVTSHYCCSV